LSGLENEVRTRGDAGELIVAAGIRHGHVDFNVPRIGLKHPIAIIAEQIQSNVFEIASNEAIRDLPTDRHQIRSHRQQPPTFK